MPYAPKAHCRECKTGYVSKGGLCDRCRVRLYPPEYRRMASRILSDWVRVHGWWCPGYKRGGHGVGPGGLTVDHVVPQARGGSHERGNLAVLCRSCNGAKQHFAQARSNGPRLVSTPRRSA